VGDAFGLAFALTYYSIALALTGDGAAAGAAGEETIKIAREVGDRWHLGLALHGSGVGARDRGDFASARSLYEESLRLFRAIGAQPGIALVVNSLGDLARLQRRYREAATYYEESLELAMDMTSKQHQAIVLHNLGHVARRLGDAKEARRCFRESLLLFRELGDILGTAECVAGLAGTAVDEDPEHAVRLFAAGVQAAEEIGVRLSSNNQPEYDDTLMAARERLGDDEFKTAWSRGRAMGLEPAVVQALEEIAAS
jgi:tetratricopeptide (TPR) repeat protein